MGGEARRHVRIAVLSLCVLAAQQTLAAAQDIRISPTRPTEVTIYPILARAPIFGANIDIASLPGEPGTGASGTTDYSLNGAYMFGAIIESRRWLFDVNGVWAALSASHSTPLVVVDSDTRFFNGTAGIRVAGGLFATAGFRRVATDLDVTIKPLAKEAALNGKPSVGVWDPMIGTRYRGLLGSSLVLDLDFRGGGFGVGSDIDLSGAAALDWRFARHWQLRGGYSLIHFKMTIDHVDFNSVARTLTAAQTLHGPEIGIGFTF